MALIGNHPHGVNKVKEEVASSRAPACGQVHREEKATPLGQIEEVRFGEDREQTLYQGAEKRYGTTFLEFKSAIQVRPTPRQEHWVQNWSDVPVCVKQQLHSPYSVAMTFRDDCDLFYLHPNL